MAQRINKKSAYIFPEAGNVILTKSYLDSMDISVSKVKNTMTANDVDDIWYDSENEWERYSICSRCNRIHSRTYESCETAVSEFTKFFNQPKTIFLDAV